MTTYKSLPDYESPPVVEVVCGILFKPLKGLMAPHLGILWEQFRSEYPICREAPPLTPVIEHFEDPPRLKVEITELPPLPRTWFLDKNENRIIQVQRDRFHHNWRKVHEEDEYPRYPVMIEKYQEYLQQFELFIKEHDLGSISPLQYEMTYVNHIIQGEGWETANDVGTIFPDFSFRINASRFLSELETWNWRTSFVLPGNVGRFHVTILHTKGDESNPPKIILNSTVRGIDPEKSFPDSQKWFDLAHEWIVYGFADLTSDKIQREIWKLKNS